METGKILCAVPLHSLVSKLTLPVRCSLVPKEYPPNQRLARWVTKQRKHFKAKSENKYHALTDEKEKRLRDAGFVFNTKTPEIMRNSVLKRYEDRWEHFVDALQQFKDEHGHCAVPRRWKKDPQLASWVMRQVRL